jgi:hypothetical protein
VDGGVDDPERASGSYLRYGSTSPPGSFGDGHDSLPCWFDQGGDAGNQRHGNGDQK